ncbi:putative disease resistance protein (TIR-NBS-LRR class) [Quillaja saponaria]|uniref:ADP-ribosyl cyclase/cyclic ADP-ribose hydrolase n=1 Tax=Quillaja saponaria TaxID=32244 RepID=A0AAD7L5H8_QUISA|nr:putative disease resistance protein (TIR-NBS-LRR class) [Quillaja saponaria]
MMFVSDFLSHLCAALERKKIRFYIDYKLKTGYEIAEALIKAIEESVLSVVIFSEDYASSRWCLNELVKIQECRKMNGQILIPVFYKIDPTHVRHQTGTYKVAFDTHEQDPKKDANLVKKWKDALSNTPNLAGLVSSTYSFEAHFVGAISEVVYDELSRVTTKKNAYDPNNDLVGIERHISEVKSLLDTDSKDVRIVGIWGIGGIGKTTIASSVYYKLKSKFDSSCFVPNVREDSKKKSLNVLRDELLSEILDQRIRVPTPDLPDNIKTWLGRRKVLVVLDDVHEVTELDYLAGRGYLKNWFGSGSRFIVTTRDRGVFRKEDKIYKAKKLRVREALELFSYHAFKRKQPESKYMEISKKVLSYAKGIPLFLGHLGSNLASLEPEKWEDELKNRKKIEGINNVLSWSYQVLDDEPKSIFLDVACFFKGEDRQFVIRILDGCGFDAESGLTYLANKSLITISKKDKIEMHDLIQDMGWRLVRQQCITNPEKRSRLWIPADVCKVLQNMGSTKIEGIFLDMGQITDQVDLDPATFASLEDLRLLRFYNSYLEDRPKVRLSRDLQCLPRNLRYLYWHGYPSKSLPSSFSPVNLVELGMPYSNAEQLWEGNQLLPKLKKIDLSYSTKLTKISKLSNARNIENINLENCTSLAEVPLSNRSVEKLIHLNLRYCKRLESLPKDIHLSSLKNLCLEGCSSLRNFHLFAENLEVLHLGGTAIQELDLSNGRLDRLVELVLDNCKQLKNLPSDICKLKYLRKFSLSGCSKLESFPEILECMESLEHLNLKVTGIKELPSSVYRLHKLSELVLSNCRKLEKLPGSICKLKSLILLNLSNCSNLKVFPEISETMGSLEVLVLVKTGIKELPLSIRRLPKLKTFDLDGCEYLQGLPSSICNLQCLETLSLSWCPKIEKLPPLGVGNMCSLKKLYLNHCTSLIDIPDKIGCLRSLSHLSLKGSNIKSIPTSIKDLSTLISLDLSDCKKLQSLPELPPFLQHLYVLDCPLLETVSIASRKDSWTSLGYNSNEVLAFNNCLKLDQNSSLNIVTDAQQRVQLMATPSSSAIPRSLVICFPGNDIPEWFKFRSMGTGSSVTVNLPPNWFNPKLMGFAVCLVAAFDNVYERKAYTDIRFRCHLKTDSVDMHSSSTAFLQSSLCHGFRYFDSDHVFIWTYNHKSFKREVNEMKAEATYHQSTNLEIDDFYYPADTIKVEKFGIRLLYDQEEENAQIHESRTFDNNPVQVELSVLARKM